jgi:acyl-CoA thioesterase-2
MADLPEVLALDEIGPDRFRSAPIPSEWARTFGGQIAAQSLMAAARTLDGSYSAHSLHGYFLRPGRPHEPTDHLVERIRDGGSFCTRRVTAVQAGEAIFTVTASFHRGDEGFSHQVDMPAHLTTSRSPTASTAGACRGPRSGAIGRCDGCPGAGPATSRGRRPASGCGSGTGVRCRTTVLSTPVH